MMQIKFGVIEHLYAKSGPDYRIVYWFDPRPRIFCKERRKAVQVELYKQYGGGNKNAVLLAQPQELASDKDERRKVCHFKCGMASPAPHQLLQNLGSVRRIIHCIITHMYL